MSSLYYSNPRPKSLGPDELPRSHSLKAKKLERTRREASYGKNPLYGLYESLPAAKTQVPLKVVS